MTLVEGGPLARLGRWVITNLDEPDDTSHQRVDELIDTLGRSSVPDALEVIGDQLAEETR